MPGLIKVEGKKFNAATQMAVSNAMIKLLDERRENKPFLMIKGVINKVCDAYGQVIGVQIGNITNETPTAATEHA